MTQEDKELLLKDLCARLPYGVRYRHFAWDDERGEECVAAQIYSIISSGYVKNCYDDEIDYIEDVRPYLRPISSMTEEEQRTLDSMCNGVEMVSRLSGLKMFDKAFNWLNENHFDYRGLIEKGLAIDVTGLNIY